MSERTYGNDTFPLYDTDGKIMKYKPVAESATLSPIEQSTIN